MSEIIKKPRGTVDYFYDDASVLISIKNKLLSLAERYGFSFCTVPTFEESRLFHRSVGESSDIVRKETFDLINKGDRSYTLRPEFTASINRAVIENKFFSSPSLPLKFSYFDKAFRYERPQTGRYREFHQFGVEIIDEKIDLSSQVETLLLAIDACKMILGDIEVKAKINFLGSVTSRDNYKKALYSFFADKIQYMCEDCKRRLETNPLRILDCKVDEDRKFIQDAPKITDYLTEEDREEFEQIKKLLLKLNVSFQVDDNLVRGLDYYTGFVFELYSDEKLGALAGGGKYSSLMKELGGPEFEGIGFSIGIERLILSLIGKGSLDYKKSLDYFVIDLRKNGDGLIIAKKLRDKGYKVSLPSFSRSMKGAIKMADRENAKNVIIVDSDMTYKLKDMSTREQKDITFEEILGL
ncbi:MAG: histidine--tRNA ligase [Candidatus Enterosoma sp.]|nr:histidine--tRNA ligase [bacterium]MDY3907824.1 histidine--tRNA ligase [Candidatus Enterosoma sp.]MDY5866509.1 histidine--tRNA ligase [Candidatus Enterosoma sp.]